MSDMKVLMALIKELEDLLVVCMKCGMCQAVCPLYARTGREADVARGKLALLEGLGANMFDDPNGVKERLDRCLLCGSCAANCPSGVSAMEIFLKARAILTEYMGMPPLKRAILRGALVSPKLFDALLDFASNFQKLFIKQDNTIIGTSCAKFSPPFLKDRHFVPLANRSFHKIIPKMDTKGGLKVAFFVGCLIDKIYPFVGKAVVDVLDYHNVGIFIGENVGCCGIPALSAGDMKTFNNLLAHNLEIFNPENFDFIITACATCTSVIKHLWPKLAEKDAMKQKAMALSGKTLDVHQFLVSKADLVSKEKRVENKAIITYHDPCHLKKSLGVFKEPRMVIEANPGYRLEEMNESDWCCGMGGSFNIEHYDISSDIGKRKMENIAAIRCDVVATGCPACMMQISDALSRAKLNISVKHPVQVYAEVIKQL